MSAVVTRRVLGAREDLMAIIVIAFGVVMVVAGAYEVYFGNTYISVERGWSAFISGTILLTGGLVTIALGVAIRAIMDLKAALTHQLAPGPAHLGHVEPAFAQPGFAQPALSEPDHARPPSEPLLGRRGTGPEAAPTSAVLAKTLAPDPAPDPPSFGGAPEHVAAAPAPHEDADAPTAPSLATQTEPFGSADVPPTERPRPSPAIEARTPAEETSPAMDDWLDRTFADLGREFGTIADPALQHSDREDREYPGIGDLRPEQVAHVDPAAPPEGAPEYLTTHEPEPPANHAPIEATPAAPAPHPTEDGPLAPSPSPVIGRYEADGTSYVMYADGSIEAQSEAGVYRFASMAELKSFIEG